MDVNKNQRTTRRRGSPRDVDIPGEEASSRDDPARNLAGDKAGPSGKGDAGDKAQALCIMFYEHRPRSPVSSRVRGLNAQTRLFPEVITSSDWRTLRYQPSSSLPPQVLV